MLSNPPRQSQVPALARPAVPEPGIARPEEIRAALRLVLGPAGRGAGDAAVDEFLRFAAERGMDPVNATRVVRVGKRVGFAGLPVTTPGGLSVLLLPDQLGRGVTPEAARSLIEQLVAVEAGRGQKLVQALIPPGPTLLRAVVEASGFSTVATLVYLKRRTKKERLPVLPSGFRLASYAPAVRHLFARAIERSYVGSLDCPRMVGLRTADEALRSHRDSGEHRPEWWHVLLQRREAGEVPVGVLLLAGVGRNAAGGLELVYIGLAPEARGRGLGDLLLRVALHAASQTEGAAVTLAADEANAPALALYRRHGLTRLQRRTAMLRDLREDCED